MLKYKLVYLFLLITILIACATTSALTIRYPKSVSRHSPFKVEVELKELTEGKIKYAYRIDYFVKLETYYFTGSEARVGESEEPYFSFVVDEHCRYMVGGILYIKIGVELPDGTRYYQRIKVRVG